MTQLEKWQVKQIENSLRLAANAFNSYNRVTCLDREIMLSLNMVCDALKDLPVQGDKLLHYRMGVGQSPYTGDNGGKPIKNKTTGIDL